MPVGFRTVGPLLCLLLSECGSHSEAPIARPAGDFGLIEEWGEANQVDFTLKWVRSTEFDWRLWRRDSRSSRVVFTTEGDLVYLGLTEHISERIVFPIFSHLKRVDVYMCYSPHLEIRSQPELELVTISVLTDPHWMDEPLSVVLADLPMLTTATVGPGGKKATSLVLERLPSLKTLEIRGYDGPRLDLRRCEGLEKLNLSSCQADNVVCIGLRKLEEVRVISHDKIRQLDLRGTTRLKALEIGCYLDCDVNTLLLDPSNTVFPGASRVVLSVTPKNHVLARLYDEAGRAVSVQDKTVTDEFLFTAP